MHIPGDLAAALAHAEGRAAAGDVEQRDDQVLLLLEGFDRGLAHAVHVHEVELLALLHQLGGLVHRAFVDESLKAARVQHLAQHLGRVLGRARAERELHQLGHAGLGALDVDDHHLFVLFGRDGQNALVLVLDQRDRVFGDFGGKLGILRVADKGHRFRRRGQFFLRLLVQAHLRLEAQDAAQRVGHALLADRAGLVGVQHEAEVFVGVVEEQEHVAARVDGGGHRLLAGHAVLKADHVGRVGDDKAVEAELVAQQVGHQLVAQGGGHHVLVFGAVELAHVFGHHDVPAHDAVQAAVDQRLVDLAVGGHPLFEREVVDVVGDVRIAEVLPVARPVLGDRGVARHGVHAVHIGFAHGGDAVGVIAESAGDDLGVFPVIVDVAHRRKGHVVAHRGGFLVAKAAHLIGIVDIAGRADLDAVGQICAVGGGAVAARFGVAGDEQRDLGVFLQRADVVLHDLLLDAVVAVAADVVFLHELDQRFVGGLAAVFKKQLPHLFLVGHACDRFFDPGDVLIGKTIGDRFQVDFDQGGPFLSLPVLVWQMTAHRQTAPSFSSIIAYFWRICQGAVFPFCRTRALCTPPKQAGGGLCKGPKLRAGA